MIKVNFTSALKRFFPSLHSMDVEAKSVAEALEAVELEFPGMKSYLLEDSGKLRKHVNIFVGEDLIQDENQMSDLVNQKDVIHIFQALSGG